MIKPEEAAQMKRRIIEEVEKCRSLQDILANDLDLEFPNNSTVYEWLKETSKYFDSDFSKNYARAVNLRTDKLFEEILTIADTPVKGITVTTIVDGEKVIKTITEAEMTQHRKLQIDARKWWLSKTLPKKYGDKLETTIEGGERPVKTVDYTKLTAATLEELAKQSDAGKPQPQ